MKLRTLLLTALLGLGALAPVNTAKADHSCERTRVTYDCHGCPIYWVYRVVDHDCHGCPIFGWVRSSPPVRHYEEDYRPRYTESYHRDHCDSGRGRSGFFLHIGR